MAPLREEALRVRSGQDLPASGPGRAALLPGELACARLMDSLRPPVDLMSLCAVATSTLTAKHIS